MSIFDKTIPEDLEDIFTDEDGFWEIHDVNGVKMKAIVHAVSLGARKSLVALGTFDANKVCIVRCVEYGEIEPEIDSIFFLDDVEYRVSASSRLGGLCIKISLQQTGG